MAFNKIVTLNLLAITADQTSPASATYQVGTAVPGMSKYKSIRFIADIVGGTGGTLDVILEQSADGITWYEFAHFPQLAAAVAKSYVCSRGTTDLMKEVGKNNASGSTLASAMTLNAGDFDGGPWLDLIRVRYVAGAGTSVGGVQAIKAVCLTEL